MLRLRTLTVFLLAMSLQSLTAQEKLLPVFHFYHRSRQEGLSTDNIRSRVVRDDRGVVWIGTVNGLERYDGYSIGDYRNSPKDPHSLSSNTVKSFLVDRKQRLWVGTYETGISLYDAARDRFLNLLPRPGDSLWLQAKSIVAQMEDRAGNIWLATDYYGVARMEIPEDMESNDLDSLVHRIRFRTYSLGTSANSARNLFEREDGKILVTTDSGLIILDPTIGTLSRLHLADPLGRRLDTLRLRPIVQDQRGNLWVGSETEGLFKLEPKPGRVTNYRHKEGNSLSINSDWIFDIVEDHRGNLWIATDIGLDFFSPLTGECTPYLTFERAPRLSFMNGLSFDKTGTLWVSTGGDGVYWLSPISQRFPNYGIRDNDGSLRPLETIERNPDGTFWCSSFGKLFKIDIANERVLRTIDVFHGKKQTLTQPDESATFIDGRGNLWYGTWGLGLYKINLATGQVKNYGYRSLFAAYTTAMSIAQGSGDTIWTTAFRDGVMKFDAASGKFVNFPIANFRVPYHVIKDRDGNIWICSIENGLCVYNPTTGSIDRYIHDPSNPRSLSQDRLRKTYQDPSGRIWVGAGNVVNLWDPGTRSFTRYPNFYAFDHSLMAEPIGTDRNGKLWVNFVDGGLSILDPSSGKYANFDNSDGVCGHFSDMENLDDGRLLLAGVKGLNILNPDSIELHRPPPPLVITRMTINDEVVPLPALFKDSGSVRLSYMQNVLEFEFAVADIDEPQLVGYRYQLEGLEKGWVRSPKNRRYVRYTAIPPGNYVFRVRATTGRGEWPDQEIALAVSIAPPWWRTMWAYAAYVILCIGFVYTGYRIRLKQVHLGQQAEMERFKAEQLAEEDRLKSRFFANISHEFRTPLTLILGPIQKWRMKVSPTLQSGVEKSQPNTREGFQPLTNAGELHNDLRMAERNAHRLLRLINQLLDLSKLEAGAMKLRASRMNIVPLVKGIAYSFESSAGMRGVGLDVRVEKGEIEVYCDRDMVEKILTNLLSNAFKFTPSGGDVSIRISNPQSPIQNHIDISVSDTGIGIPPDQLDKVFDRFYQVDASQTREHEGSGLGLALVKELVELHRGTIQVQSKVGRGTTFTVRLPLGRSHLKGDEVVEATAESSALRGTDLSAISSPERSDAISSQDQIVPPSTIPLGSGIPERGTSARENVPRNDDVPIILIVEDNADVRSYIKDYLVPAYQVTEAGDGAEGIEKALEVIPDLIISDVMMPKKGGYEVCRALKQDVRTSHVPVILLTARAGTDNKIEGLETGADDYVTKPFEPKELLARVKNLIEQRKQLRKKFSAGVVLKPGEVAVTSLDDELLKKIMDAVEKNIGDENFSVDDLAKEACLSRTNLNRKVHALTNLPPVEFIRYVRLQRARELLEKNAAPVADIAYQVGFGSPAYFSTCFHDRFGISPSEVHQRQ